MVSTWARQPRLRVPPSRAAGWKLSQHPELLEASALWPSGGLGMSHLYYSARQWACHLSCEDTSPLRMS